MKASHCLLGFAGLGFLLATGCSSEPSTDFYVSLTFIDQEVSEDSNSRTETILIEGDEGTYTWIYDGYHPDGDFDTEKEFDFELNEEELHDLTLLIRENGLMVSREDTVSTGEPWSAFDITWEMRMGGQSSRGHLEGKPVEWDDWDASEQDSFVADEGLYAVEQVMEYVRNLER